MIYSSPRKYRQLVWAVVFVRVLFLLFLAFTLLAVMFDADQLFEKGGKILVTIIIVAGIVMLAVAFRLKCDSCGKQIVITWGSPYLDNTISETIKDTFYPIELRLGRFKCPKCKVEFEL